MRMIETIINEDGEPTLVDTTLNIVDGEEPAVEDMDQNTSNTDSVSQEDPEPESVESSVPEIILTADDIPDEDPTDNSTDDYTDLSPRIEPSVTADNIPSSNDEPTENDTIGSDLTDVRPIGKEDVIEAMLSEASTLEEFLEIDRLRDSQIPEPELDRKDINQQDVGLFDDDTYKPKDKEVRNDYHDSRN